jgi:hypothetical protein
MSNRQSGTIVKDAIEPNGRVEIFVTRGSPKIEYWNQVASGPVPVFRDHVISFDGCEILDQMVLKNIIVNQGKDKMIEALVGGTVDKVLRMAIGDRGTIPSDNSVPKVPTPDMTRLYNEVARGDLDAVVLNIGSGTAHEAKFIKVFAARDIPLSSFSNQISPIVNEVGIITAGDQIPFPRADLYPPTAANDDEKLFAIRTYRAVPFEAADDIEITFRYTVYID